MHFRSGWQRCAELVGSSFLEASWTVPATRAVVSLAVAGQVHLDLGSHQFGSECQFFSQCQSNPPDSIGSLNLDLGSQVRNLALRSLVVSFGHWAITFGQFAEKVAELRNTTLTRKTKSHLSNRRGRKVAELKVWPFKTVQL